MHKIGKDPVARDFLYDSADSTFISDTRAKSDTPKITQTSFKKPLQKVNKIKEPTKVDLETISEAS